MQRRGSAYLVLVSLTLSTATTAGAQTKVMGFALDRFEPSVPIDAFFGVGSPAIGGHLVPRAAFVFDYAQNPLKIAVGATGSATVVTGQGILHVGLSLPLWNRFLLSADVPIALVDSGSAPNISGLNYHVPGGPAMGDLRLGARGWLVGGYRDPFQVGIAGGVYVPSGSVDAYMSKGSTRGSADLLLGGRVGEKIGFVWSASGGALLQGAAVAPLVRYGAGVALTIDQDWLQVGPELYGSTPIGSPAPVENPGPVQHNGNRGRAARWR